MKLYPDEEMMYETQLETVNEVRKAKKRNHILSLGLAGITSITCIVLCAPNILDIDNHVQSVAFSLCTSFYFVLVATLLMWSLINLLVTFKSHLVGELEAELKTIITFLIYFSAVFVFRAVIIVLAYFHYWPQFNRYWENGTYDPLEISIWSIQFIIYSAAPIFYMAVVHCFNFSKQKLKGESAKNEKAIANNRNR